MTRRGCGEREGQLWAGQKWVELSVELRPPSLGAHLAPASQEVASWPRPLERQGHQVDHCSTRIYHNIIVDQLYMYV